MADPEILLNNTPASTITHPDILSSLNPFITSDWDDPTVVDVETNQNGKKEKTKRIQDKLRDISEKARETAQKISGEQADIYESSRD